MHDETDQIIYVGKAISLKNRVRQYFQSSRNKGVKIEQMVTHIRRFEYIVTDSELEALVLECNLIKEHRPKYNTMLMDDKTYPFIKVTVNEPFPRVLLARKMLKDKAKYFGPYTSAQAVRDTIDLIHKLYHVRSCNRNLPKDIGKERPCLNYHIKQCMGVCRGYISQESYAEIIQQAKAYIQMGSTDSVKRMQAEMERAAEELDFERAAMLRDRIAAVTKAGETQKIMDAALEEADVIAMAEHGGTQCVSILRYRGRRLFDKETFFFQENASREEVMDSYLTQYYEHHRADIPKNIVLEFAMPNQEMYEQLFTGFAGFRVRITVPQRGTLCQFVQLSRNNANEELAIRFNRTGREVQALEELGIPLPNPDKPKGRHNNRKQTFDAVCRTILFDIAKRHGLHLEQEPSYGGRDYLEKQDYILMKQKEQLATQEKQLEELTLTIEDVEPLLEDVSGAAYDKAVEVVTDKVREQTQLEDMEVIEKYRKSVVSPNAKNSPEVVKIANTLLSRVREKLQQSAEKVLKKVQAVLLKPEVKQAGKEQIKNKARKSIKEKLAQGKLDADRENRERWEREGRIAPTRKQDMEL